MKKQIIFHRLDSTSPLNKSIDVVLYSEDLIPYCVGWFDSITKEWLVINQNGTVVGGINSVEGLAYWGEIKEVQE